MARILVAGPQEFVTSNRDLLKENDFHLFQGKSISEAIGLVFDDPPDFLILEKGFGGNRDIELIKAAKACLQKAHMPIILLLPGSNVGDMSWQAYHVDDFLIQPSTPELLLARIKLAEARMNRVFDNNPLSKLPGNTSIIKEIQKILPFEESYAVCYADIDNFKPYNDRYGFSRGDEVIIMTARIIVNVVDEIARHKSFVGHVGGDDFVFVVLAEKAKDVCEKILTHFELVKNMFLSPADVKAGNYSGIDRQGTEKRFDLLSLSIAAVITGKNKFKHYGQVSEAASQLKSYVKKQGGSNFMIDRRQEP